MLFLIDGKCKGDGELRIVGHIIDCFEADDRASVDEGFRIVTRGGFAVHHGRKCYYGLPCGSFRGADGPVAGEFFNSVIASGGPGAGDILDMPGDW